MNPTERRSFLTHLKRGAAALALAGAAKAQVKPAAHWEPARDNQDDWLEQASSKHRLVFDVTHADGFGEALLFANNYLLTNRNVYGLANKELAVLIIARHRAAAFGYGDAMWAKYSAPISARAQFIDPKTPEPPKINPYNNSNSGGTLANGSVIWPDLVKQGVQLAVCASATHGFAAAIAKAAGITDDEVFTALTSNLVGNARMVPAGIVAVARAQERGYSLVST